MKNAHISRRDLLSGTAAAAFGIANVANPTLQSRALRAALEPQDSPFSTASTLTYRLMGVPYRTGSLYPGNENDAQAYRDANLPQRLKDAGVSAVDDGDLAVPSYLPHHSVPPIRNWPGPRIVWDLLSERVTPLLHQPGQIPLLLGCDCSVVVGTTQALKKLAGETIHVLYVDGDFDDAAPDSENCQSAASLAVWLLVNESPFCVGPPLRPEQVSVVGWTNPARSVHPGMRSVSRSDVQRLGAQNAARAALSSIPGDAAIVLHLDIDVFSKRVLPVAYFPHDEGLNLAEGRDLLGVLLKDPRVRVIEVSEYATLRDLDRRGVNAIVDLLTNGLRRS